MLTAFMTMRQLKGGRVAAQADIVLAKPSIEGEGVCGQVYTTILRDIDALLARHNPNVGRSFNKAPIPL